MNIFIFNIMETLITNMENINLQKPNTDSQIDFYYTLENKLKQVLSRNLEKQFYLMYNKLSEKEKFFFNAVDPQVTFNLNWNINVNVSYNNRGDLFTSSLQKFFHLIFKQVDDSEEAISEGLPETKNDGIIKDEYTKFKNTFIDIFNINLILILGGENLELEGFNLNDYFGKFEIKNGFLNIFTKGRGIEIVAKIKEKFCKDKKVSKEVQNESQFLFNSIAYIDSCFPEKFSVPRQGKLLELTRAKIIFNKNFDMSAIDGIEHFDYIWIIYVFHLNQNFSKSKISPPKFDGNKLGFLATRSPHRINPIGLTLAKIIKIEKNEILISLVDMISGTPVLDIKPYHHLESLDIENIKYPSWIRDEADDKKKALVNFSEKALSSLENIIQNKKLLFYDNYEDILAVIKGILEIDPHSKYTQKKKEVMLYAFYVDKLNIIYEYDAMKKEVNIQNIEYSEEYKKLRNKSWLENYEGLNK